MAFGLTRSDDSINWVQPVNWQSPLNEGLVGWWLAVPNQPGWKSDLWLDLTDPVNGGHGVFNNMIPEDAWISRNERGAVTFSSTGTDDYVAVPAKLKYNLAETAGTVTWWMKAAHTQANSFNSVIDCGDGDSLGQHAWFIRLRGDLDDGSLRVMIEGSFVNFSANSYPDNEWVWMAVVWDGSTIYLYRNGLLIETGTQPTGTYRSSQTGDLHIGALMANGGPICIDGALDSVRVHAAAFTEGDVRDLYVEEALGYSTLLNRVPHRYYSVQAAPPVAAGFPYQLYYGAV